MYNWKNVQYANSSGILSAMAENNKQAAAGRQQMVDSIQGVVDYDTETRQNAFDNAVSQQQMEATGMSARASAMNAQANMAEVQRKLDPAYIDMQNAEIAAKTKMYAAQMLNYENDAKDSKFRRNMMESNFPEYFGDSKENTTSPTIYPEVNEGTPIGSATSNDATDVTTKTFPDNIFNRYTPKNHKKTKTRDSFATQFDLPALSEDDYTSARDTDTLNVINNTVAKWINAPVAEQADIIKSFKSDMSSLPMGANAQVSYAQLFDDKIKTARDNIVKAKEATTVAQTESLQAQIYNWKVGEPVPTTASVVNSTNLTAKAVNSILQPVQEIEERDKFISKFSNDTNLAVQDENGLYRLTKAGIAEYNKDIKLLKNTRKHWNNPQIFENTLKSFLNVESSKNILSNEKTIAAADTSEINIRHNTNQDTVYKYTTQTYTPSATWNKLGLDNLNPEKIENVVKRIQNDDTWFKNNEWILYQAIQQIGGVDSDWLTRNELETVSNNSNWWMDQNEDVTLAALYKHAIRLRRAHTSGRTYRTKSGKEYTQPLVVMSPASKEAQLKHENTLEQSYLDTANSVDTETEEFTINKRGRKVKKKTTKK